MEPLKSVAGHTRLFRRGATYYHRAVVPKDIVQTYGKREETFSLKTREYAEAVRLVRIAAVEVDRKFDAHRLKLVRTQASIATELSAEQIAAIKAAYYQHRLDEDEEVRLEGFEPERNANAIAQSEEATQFEPRHTFDEYAELNEDMDEISRAALARGQTDAFFRGEAEDLLSWEGIALKLDPKSKSWPRVVRAVQEASVEAADAIRRRNKGDSVPTPPSPTRDTPVSRSAPLMSAAVRTWSDEKSRSNWTPKVRDDHLAWANIFMQISGDRPITAYRKEDIRGFKDLLMKLPANASKRPEIRGLPLKAAAERAVQLGIEPMSLTTMNKAVRRLGAFWNWAEANFDNVHPNLTKGMTVKANVAARDQRNPFTPDELKKLFSSPLFVGCKSEHFVSTPGSTLLNDRGRFWLPLLGLYTGARLNELCQLLVDDIKSDDGIPYLNITNEGEGQRVKTASGKRRIPIHRDLIALGLPSLVTLRKKQGVSRLFPELRQGKDGYFSGEASRSFSRYIEKIGIKTDKSSFHSFRHCFEDACRAATIGGEVMDALQGHAEGGQRDRYGKGYPLTVLDAAVQKLRYPIDLTHIPKLVL